MVALLLVLLGLYLGVRLGVQSPSSAVALSLGAIWLLDLILELLLDDCGLYVLMHFIFITLSSLATFSYF